MSLKYHIMTTLSTSLLSRDEFGVRCCAHSRSSSVTSKGLHAIALTMCHRNALKKYVHLQANIVSKYFVYCHRALFLYRQPVRERGFVVIHMHTCTHEHPYNTWLRTLPRLIHFSRRRMNWTKILTKAIANFVDFFFPEAMKTSLGLFQSKSRSSVELQDFSQDFLY